MGPGLWRQSSRTGTEQRAKGRRGRVMRQQLRESRRIIGGLLLGDGRKRIEELVWCEVGGAGNIDIETLRWSGQRTAGIDLELRIGPAPNCRGRAFRTRE